VSSPSAGRFRTSRRCSSAWSRQPAAPH
jgi:hypothetical protein